MVAKGNGGGTQGLIQSQGARRKKQSCLHTAILLQEMILDVLENIFVSYFDVSEAFDGVQTNRFFIQLYD